MMVTQSRAPLSISSRIVLAALLPSLAMALLLAAVFMSGRLGDIESAFLQRVATLARQLAVSCELPLFTSNQAQLEVLAHGALHEAGVQAVLILDRHGKTLVNLSLGAQFPEPHGNRPATAARLLLSSSGQVLGRGQTIQLQLTDHAFMFDDPARALLLLAQPVQGSPAALGAFFAANAQAGSGYLLGHVVLEVSRLSHLQRLHEIWLAGILVTLGVLAFGAALALAIAHSVVQPVLRVSTLVQRIAAGDLTARLPIAPFDPLQDLQLGLNQMAEHLASGRDTLEQRIAAATLELRQKKDEAERAVLGKAQFLSAASHDLRQPMHAIGLFVARLGQLRHDQATRELVHHLEDSVHSMQDLLDALLDFSRLEGNTVPVRPQVFAIAALFEQVQQALAEVANNKALRLRLRRCDAMVLSDPALLYRVLLNLVSNALRYTERGGVLLACRRCDDGRALRLEVWDSGIGIAPQHQQEIFNEFFQINRHLHGVRGLGLGLAIVRRTAQLLEIPLTLCSRPGQGSRFTVTLPIATPHQIASAAIVRIRALPLAMPPESNRPDEFDGLHVLLIEDDLQSRRALTLLLASWGCIVSACTDQAEVMHRLQHDERPDLVISDYHLPDAVNGAMLISQVRLKFGLELPACLISGDTDPALLHTLHSQQLTLLHKPVRPAHLRTLMRRLLAGRKTR